MAQSTFRGTSQLTDGATGMVNGDGGGKLLFEMARGHADRRVSDRLQEPLALPDWPIIGWRPKQALISCFRNTQSVATIAFWSLHKEES